MLGGIYIRRGDLQRAIQFCQQSVQVYQAIDDIVGQSHAYNNLANAYSDMGDWNRASEAFHKSLAIKQKIGDVFYEGAITNNLANIYLYRGEWITASDLFKQSYTVWRQIGATLLKGVTLSNLAQVHIYQQNWFEAQSCLKRSQVIFDEIGSEDFLPELERRWGEFYLKTGHLDQALSHIRRSIELALSQEARLEKGMSYRTLGMIHLARGEDNPAEVALEKSLKILDDLNSEYESAKTKLVLGRLFSQGDPAKAVAHLHQATKTFEKLGAQADLAEVRGLEAELI